MAKNLIAIEDDTLEELDNIIEEEGCGDYDTAVKKLLKIKNE